MHTYQFCLRPLSLWGGWIALAVGVWGQTAQDQEIGAFLEDCRRSYLEGSMDACGSYLRNNVGLGSWASPALVQESREYVFKLSEVAVRKPRDGDLPLDAAWLRDYAARHVAEQRDWSRWLSWGNTFVHGDEQRIREALHYPASGYVSHTDWLLDRQAKATFFEHEGRHVTVTPWNSDEQPRPDSGGWKSPWLFYYLAFLEWALERGAEHTWSSAEQRLHLHWTVDPVRPETEPGIPVPGLVALTGGRYELTIKRSELQGPPARNAFDLSVLVRDVHGNLVLQSVFLGAGGLAGYLLYEFILYYPGVNVPQHWSLLLFTPLPAPSGASLSGVPDYRDAEVWDIRLPSQGFEYRYQGMIPRVADLPEYVAAQRRKAEEGGRNKDQR